MALSMLSVPDMLKRLAPDAHFTFVMQNVDGLSRRAPEPTPGADASASPIYEMHGRLFETLCTACGDRRTNTDSPTCAALGGTEAVVQTQEHEPEPPPSRG